MVQATRAAQITIFVQVENAGMGFVRVKILIARMLSVVVRMVIYATLPVVLACNIRV